MNPAMGKLTGTGYVLGPDGKVKAEFRLEADCTPEQAAALANDVTVTFEENDDGSNAR